MNTAIVMPAMNEEQSIGKVLMELNSLYDTTVIVVDDFSTDATVEIAKNHSAVVLKHTSNLGAWRATQTGIRYALKSGFHWVITCDADGQHTLESVSALIEESNNNIDCLIGSCTARGSTGRHIAWHFFKFVSGLDVSDLTSGLRMYNRKAMRVLASRQATMFEYQDVGVLIMLKKLNMSVKEISVKMNQRENGISRIFHSWLAVFRYLLYTLVLSLTKIGPHKANKYHKELISKANNE